VPGRREKNSARQGSSPVATPKPALMAPLGLFYMGASGQGANSGAAPNNTSISPDEDVPSELPGG
jgi:hypothetical protein